MTKKHFIFAAELIANMTDSAQEAGATIVCVRMFKMFGPLFDEDRFRNHITKCANDRYERQKQKDLFFH